MTLPTPTQRFNKKESGLDTAVETVATVSMRIEAKEAKDIRDILIYQLLLMPYGDTCIEKLQCVGYVEKRMGTRLRASNLKIKGLEIVKPHSYRKLVAVFETACPNAPLNQKETN
ncbi:hypothetical protein TNCV_2572621 [Trichonephila clavipes]|nr:hypothetical protein TNCV_2572621 [Trichonephila clavipes]